MLESLLILMCYCEKPVAVCWQSGQDINLRAYSALRTDRKADEYFGALCNGKEADSRWIKVWSLDKLNGFTCPRYAESKS